MHVGLGDKRARRHSIVQFQIDLVEVGDDDIGTGVLQVRTMADPVDADDEAETAGSSRRHAGDRVLDDDRAIGQAPKALRRRKKSVGRWLAREPQGRGIASVDASVEQMIEPRSLQNLLAIAARRNHRRLQAERAQTPNQGHRGRIDVDPFAAHPLQEQSVLSYGEALDGFDLGTIALIAFREAHAARGQEGTNGLFARTPVDVLAVVLKREWREGNAGATGVPFEKNIEGLRPSLEMDARGICHHAIEIEGDGIKLRRNKTGFARHASAHGVIATYASIDFKLNGVARLHIQGSAEEARMRT
nr:hypothetical protein [Bradyrhizobium elkanii]